MVQMRGQNQCAPARRALEPNQDVAETISLRAQTVRATNGFSFRTDRGFVVWRCRMPHEALGDGEEILRVHGRQIKEPEVSRGSVPLAAMQEGGSPRAARRYVAARPTPALGRLSY